MQVSTDQIKIVNFLKGNIDLILKDFDRKVSETKQKHFVVVKCTDAKKYTPKEHGKAYEFIFFKIASPEFGKLNLEFQEKIYETKLSNDVCIVVADEYNKLTLINYKRDPQNLN